MLVVRGDAMAGTAVNASVTGAARTAFARRGGQLRALDANALGAHAVGLLGAAADIAVVSSALPGEIVLGARRVVRVRCGLEALVVAASLAVEDPVLVVGTDSASQAPLYASREGGYVEDPLAAHVAAAGARIAGLTGDRAAEDVWAARSRTAISSGDDPRTYSDLTALKPLFDEQGTATAGSTALPADGAAAALVVPGRPAGAMAVLGWAAEPEDLALDGLVAAEIHEGTACEAMAISRRLGLDHSIVNTLGGAIGLGHPPGASAVAMAGRLYERLLALGGGNGLLVAPGIAVLVAV